MVFNSIAFLVFFILFFTLYWSVLNKNLTVQNLFLLAACYVFYAWVDWRFLFLLIANSTVNYFLGIYISKDADEKRRKILFYIGLIFGIGILLYFKYFNFFVSSVAGVFSILHINLNIHTIKILLPLGISFYTFRTLSYIIDIYQGKTKPVTDWVVFFSYVAFFPCVVSGPIDRANLLVPQLEKKRVFTYESGVDGIRQILWGLFKKIVIADTCAIISDQIFDHYQTLPGSTLFIGAFFFCVDLYADFSGYSDIAIGVARLLGFNVTRNFNYPYFAQNIPDYWRRWHISLTSWVTDYVFTPLSISLRDYAKWGTILAIILNMVIVGVWHGPNWTFVLYGFISGLYFIPLILMGTMNKRKKLDQNKLLPSFAVFKGILGTFLLTMLTDVIFRTRNVTEAFHFYARLFSGSIISRPVMHDNFYLCVVPFVTFMFAIEWVGKSEDVPIRFSKKVSPVVRYAIYFILFYSSIAFMTKSANSFIYFQF